ncbi:MAG: hypothetical protein AAFR21_01395 [Pseudomonadota bacterium]
MSKQFQTFYVSWRDALSKPFGLFANEASYGRAAADALEQKLNQLAEEGWIVDRIIPCSGIVPKQNAAFTIIAFK